MIAHLEAPVSTERRGGQLRDADVIVIGAGPAGMSAVVELAGAGRRIIVLDMQPAPGGQIFRALEANMGARSANDGLLATLGSAYKSGQALIRSFRAAPGIDYRPGTTVWDVRADGTVGWLRGQAAGYLRARYIVMANGAMERPVPFPGWTLPGVMTAGAVQTLIKAGRLKPEGRIVLAGTGPLLFLLADQLRRLGVRPVLIARTDRLRDKVAAIVKIRPSTIPMLLKGLGWIARLRVAGIPMLSGVSGLRAQGQDRVERVIVKVGGRSVDMPCDLLIVHDGIVPAIDLAHSAGVALEWNEFEASWRPTTLDNGLAELATGATLTTGPCRIFIAGDARRIGGAEAAIAHGRHVGQAVLSELDCGDPFANSETSAAVRRSLVPRSFIDRAFPIGLAATLPDDQAIICRCEEITAGEVRDAIGKGTTDIDLLRGLLRCGMGQCQGRHCAVTLARMIGEAGQRKGLPKKPFRARPPARPLPLGALATLEGVDPELAQFVSLDDKPEAATEDYADA